MASGPDDGGSFIGQVLAWVAAAIAGIGAWLWANTMGRIAALEREKVGTKEFEDYRKQAEKSRDELRDSVITLFNKVDGLRNHVDQKFDKMTDLLTEIKRGQK